MAAFVEFVAGTWLDVEDAEAGREAEMLVHLCTDGVFDALLALERFEVSLRSSRSHITREDWERDAELERARAAELEAHAQIEPGTPSWFQWHQEIRDRARRDVARQKWDAGQLPSQLERRWPFLYAELFVTSLAQVGRTLHTLASLSLGGARAELVAADAQFAAGLPALKAVRDSVEHAEDRLRGRNRKGEALTLAPVTNSAVHAPGGGALIGGMLNNDNFGWTADDGTYQEVPITDATIEVARAAVQSALDALPWKSHGFPRYLPY